MHHKVAVQLPESSPVIGLESHQTFAKSDDPQFAQRPNGMSARTQNKPQRIGTAAFNYRFRACKSGRLIKKQLSTAKGSIFASPPKPPGQSCGWMKTRARGRFSEATWYRQAAVAESPPTHRQHYAQQHQRPPLRTSDLGLSTADEQDPQQVGPFQSLQQTNQKSERAKNDEKRAVTFLFQKLMQNIKMV